LTCRKDDLKKECENLRAETQKVAPLEQQIEDLKLANLQAISEAEFQKEQFEAERQKVLAIENSIQEMRSKLQEANEQVAILNEQLTHIQTEKADMETEFKIQDRKSQRMIKELKAELQKERTTIGRSASSEQLAPPSPGTTPRHTPPLSPVPLNSTPPPSLTPRTSRQFTETINSLPLLSSSLSNMELSQNAMEEVLRRDLEQALTMVGRLGEEKWKLEEKARYLEENLSSLNEDLVRKTEVIRYYVSKTKQVVTAEHLAADKEKHRRQSGVLGTLMRSGADSQELSVEILSKMESVLEETVLKNIQLQNDMVTLAGETGQLQKSVTSLKEENKRLAEANHQYQEQLVRLMSNPHV